MKSKDIKKIKGIKKQLEDMNVDEIVRSEVKPFGTSAHVNIPKKHRGKEAIIIIKKLKENHK